MKIVTRTSSTMSLFVLNDDEVLTWDDRGMIIGSPEWMIVPDCPAETVTIFDNISSPEDWEGGKYLFDGTTWTISPKWVEPTPEPEPEP
jgi:hypothetical protein